MNTKIKRVIPVLLAIFIFSFSSVIVALADGEEASPIPAGQSVEGETPTPVPPLGGPTTFAFSDNLADTTAFPDSMLVTSTSISLNARNAIQSYLNGVYSVAADMGQLRAIIPTTVDAVRMTVDAFRVISQLSPTSLTTVNNLPSSIPLNKGSAPFQNVTTVTTSGGNVTGSNINTTVISGNPILDLTGNSSVTVTAGAPTGSVIGSGTLTINGSAMASLTNYPTTFINNSSSNNSYNLTNTTTNITQASTGTGTITTTNLAANITKTGAAKVVYSGSATMRGTIVISSGELHIPKGHNGILTVSGTAKVAITGNKTGTLTMSGGTVWAQNLAAAIATPISGKLIAGASVSSFTVNAGASFTVATSYTPGITGLPTISSQTGISSGTITNNGTVNIANNTGIVNHNANATTTIGSYVSNVSYAGSPTPTSGGINFSSASWTGTIDVGSIRSGFEFPLSSGGKRVGTIPANSNIVIKTLSLVTIGDNQGRIIPDPANLASNIHINNNNAAINTTPSPFSTITAGDLTITTNNSNVVYTVGLTGGTAPEFSVNNNSSSGVVVSDSNTLIRVDQNSGSVANISGNGDVFVNSNKSNGVVTNAHTTLVNIANNSAVANNASSGPMVVDANTGTVNSTGAGLVTVTSNNAGGEVNANPGTGNIVVPTNASNADVNINDITGTHLIGTPGAGTKNNGTVNITAANHTTTIYNNPTSIYDPALGSVYALAAANCQVHITAAASPIIYGSGYINVTNGAAGPAIGLGNMPTLGADGTTNRPYVKMSGNGILGITTGVQPTRIEGDGTGYKLFLATGFAGSTSGNGLTGLDGGDNFIAFKAFDGELHVGGTATTTSTAIPAGVKTLHLDNTALNYTEQWATGGTHKKVTLLNPTATYNVVFRAAADKVANSFYPNATAGAGASNVNTAHRTIGEGITEMVVKAATTFRFYSTESSASTAIHSEHTTGMKLGGSGGGGTFNLTTAPATTELYFGLGTFDNTLTTYATLQLPSVTSVVTFTSYNDNLKINAVGAKFTNVNLHNRYPALNAAGAVFNSSANEIMVMAPASRLDLTIGAAATALDGTLADGSGAGAVNLPLVPTLFRLDVPKVATLTMNGLNADPTVYITPSTTTSVTFGDGFASSTNRPQIIKLHGSKELTNIYFTNKGTAEIGENLKVLDLKVPQGLGSLHDNTEVPIDGITGIDKLLEVPTISGWTYAPNAAATPPVTDKKLDLRDNAIPSIGDDFSNTDAVTPAVPGNRSDLTTKLSGAWINQLDVRGNSMVLINLDEINMKAHLTNLAYVRGNESSMKYVNLSNCEKIVNANTFTRTGTTDIVIGPDIPAVGMGVQVLHKVQYLWLDNLPQLRLAYATPIPVLYWENNEISEFTMTNPANTEIINIDLSNNKILHVNTGLTGGFGSGGTYGSGANAIDHSNIRLEGSIFDVSTAGSGFIDLSFQVPSLISVTMDDFLIRDIWMGYNPALKHISLTGMPNLEDFNLRSITGKEASGGASVPLNISGTAGAPATFDPLTLQQTGACTTEGVFNIPIGQVAAPPRQDYDTNYPTKIPDPSVSSQRANNFNITYVDYSNSPNIPHTVANVNTGITDSAFNIVNNSLETVKFNGCTQLAGKVLYLQNNKISSLEIKDIGATSIQGIDLSANEIKNFNYIKAPSSATPIPPISNMNLQGTQVEESLILSWNPIVSINVNGLEIDHMDISHATTATNTVKGGTHHRIEGEVVFINSTTLTAFDIDDNHLTKGLNLSNNPKLQHIIGTLNGTSVNNTADSSMIQGVLNLTKSAAITDLAGNSNISFPGHLITNAILVDTFNENINLKRNNGMGETSVLTTIPAITSEADRGDLKEINISSTAAPSAAPRNTKLLNADDNIIEVVNTMNPAASNVKMSNTMFAPNSMIRMNFNNIHTFKISQTGQDGYAGLETIHLDNNRMKHLEATQMAGLMYLEVDRTIYNANSLARAVVNLYNSFEDGTVTLTGSAKLVYFHPGTTIESDRLVDERVIRKNPVEPNEHQWVSNANSTAASIGLTAVYTNTSATKSKLDGGPNWGYYSRVPLVSFNAIGCTNIESIRIPGNRLTAATLRLDSTASNLLYLDISGAEATDSGSSDTNYLPNPSRTRGFRPAKAGTMYDAASGQIGGAFTLQWPKLEVFRIQNNQITSLQTSKSPLTLEILAHNNKISSLEITGLPNMLYLDVERNSLSQITLPIGNMQIFRAGQNRLNAYPNTNKVPSLRQLYLNHNRLGGDYPHLTANVNLQILNVAFNNIESLAGTNLMPSLEEIYAYNNIIEGYHGLYINGSGGGNLKIADFSQNKILTIIDLPDSLVYLDMSYNKFAGELQMKSPIPTGMSRSTSYPVKAHEVYSGHDIEYGQANSFVGTFDIRENQISGLPGKLPEAWLEFAAKSSGRMVYNMIVKYNILDIDIYDITTPKVDGHVPRNTGEQKWLSINPEANIVVQQYMDYEAVIGAIEPELRLFHPIKKSYELPSRVHEYHYWWNKLEYEDIVSPLSNLIRQTGYIPIKVRINGTGWEDVGSINGFVPVAVNVIDKRENPNQTTPNAGMAKTYLIDGETGKVTIISADDDDENYNPNTGASA